MKDSLVPGRGWFATRAVGRSLFFSPGCGAFVYAGDDTMSIAWIIALLLSSEAGADKPPVAIAAHVRAAASAGRIVEDASRRSPTIRDLVERLAATDVIVYVEIVPLRDVPTARTKLVTATPAARFLRIGINNAVPPMDIVPLLAHELQHVVEIAEQTDVRDDAGVRRLYRRIGHQHGVDSYETDAAAHIERIVRTELQRPPLQDRSVTRD
jgi:hypothetical protein